MSRYKQHKTDFKEVPSERPLALPCQVRGCHCPAYQYTPRIGPNPVRCQCKHLPQDHSEAFGHLCKKCESEITQTQIIYVILMNAVNVQDDFSNTFPQFIFQAVPVLGSRAPTPVGVVSPALPTRPW